jgi:peroxiredoxin
MPRICALGLFGLALALAGVVRAAAPVTLPATLHDVYGASVDVAELATRHRLVVVTLKTPACPVCRSQLERLRHELPRLRSCGATFIVLAPGPRDALRAVAEETGFPYPFVEDRDLAIARAADLVLAPEQIVPAILVANARREIVWMDRGRNAASFNDPALLAELDCPPDRMASALGDDRVGEGGARDEGRHQRAEDRGEDGLEQDELAEGHLCHAGEVERRGGG